MTISVSEGSRASDAYPDDLMLELDDDNDDYEFDDDEDDFGDEDDDDFDAEEDDDTDDDVEADDDGGWRRLPAASITRSASPAMRTAGRESPAEES